MASRCSLVRELRLLGWAEDEDHSPYAALWTEPPRDEDGCTAYGDLCCAVRPIRGEGADIPLTEADLGREIATFAPRPGIGVAPLGWAATQPGYAVSKRSSLVLSGANSPDPAHVLDRLSDHRPRRADTLGHLGDREPFQNELADTLAELVVGLRVAVRVNHQVILRSRGR